MRTGDRLPLPLPRQALLRPDHPALIADGVACTYATLATEADACARRLAGRGVRGGDRVAVCLADGCAFAVLLHAVARLQAILVPLNNRLVDAELAWQIADCDPRLVVWDPALGDRLKSPLLGTDTVTVRRADEGEVDLRVPALPELAAADVHLADDVPADAPATMIYTSGTSGLPRGAVLSHGNHLWSALGSALRLGVSWDDRWLSPLPLFHVGGMSVLLRSALAGTTAVLHSRFDAAAVAASLRHDRITLVSLVPTMLSRLLDVWGDEAAPPSLRAVLLGGGALDPALLARAAALGLPIAPTYGLTEAASQVATARPGVPADVPGRPPAMPPLPFTTVRVVDASGRDVATGMEGDILVGGPTVMTGYWSSSAGQVLARRAEWWPTNDVGYLDHAGRLTVLGRRADLIVSGGENVYPAEVEAVLDRHPAVAESCIVGLPDAEWGAVVVAVIVPATAHPPDEALLDQQLDQHVRASLAGYKAPRRYVRRAEALPRTAAGKLRRTAVRAALLGQPVAGPERSDGEAAARRSRARAVNRSRVRIVSAMALLLFVGIALLAPRARDIWWAPPADRSVAFTEEAVTASAGLPSLQEVAKMVVGNTWTVMMADDAAFVGSRLTTGADVAARFGAPTGLDPAAEVALVLVDVWPRYSLQWYRPPVDHPDARPDPVRYVAVVFRPPGSEWPAVRFGRVPDPIATAEPDLDLLTTSRRLSLAWDD